MKLTTAIPLALATLGLLFLSPAPAEACSCFYGASCGVDIYNTPCGTVVCGNDYQLYRCTSGSWQALGTACGCLADDSKSPTSLTATDEQPTFFELTQPVFTQVSQNADLTGCDDHAETELHKTELQEPMKARELETAESAVSAS